MLATRLTDVEIEIMSIGTCTTSHKRSCVPVIDYGITDNKALVVLEAKVPVPFSILTRWKSVDILEKVWE